MTGSSPAARDPTQFETLDSFLDELGVRDEVTIQAIKEVVALQLERAMKEHELSRKAMAARMKTSPAQLRRVLDPMEGNITLDTLVRAAHVVGRRLRIELV
jgi:hypothetical protein